LVVTQFARLQYRDAGFQRHGLHRWWCELHVAALWFVRLAKHAWYIVPGVY
jgi:hypothetical protein